MHPALSSGKARLKWEAVAAPVVRTYMHAHPFLCATRAMSRPGGCCMGILVLVRRLNVVNVGKRSPGPAGHDRPCVTKGRNRFVDRPINPMPHTHTHTHRHTRTSPLSGTFTVPLVQASAPHCPSSVTFFFRSLPGFSIRSRPPWKLCLRASQWRQRRRGDPGEIDRVAAVVASLATGHQPLTTGLCGHKGKP